MWAVAKSRRQYRMEGAGEPNSETGWVLGPDVAGAPRPTAGGSRRWHQARLSGPLSGMLLGHAGHPPVTRSTVDAPILGRPPSPALLPLPWRVRRRHGRRRTDRLAPREAQALHPAVQPTSLQASSHACERGQRPPPSLGQPAQTASDKPPESEILSSPAALSRAISAPQS